MYTCYTKSCNPNRYENGGIYEENYDFGYYSEILGDCTMCQDYCSKDANCGAVTCGTGGYCIWWKNNVCKPRDRLLLDRNRYSGVFLCVKSK